MKHFLTRHLLTINEDMVLDPVMLKYMKMLFDLANKMGLQGIEVGYLSVVPPRADGCVIQPCTIWCKQGCTEEEEKLFRERQKEIARNAALSGWCENETSEKK